ncbi:hypothetical protein LIER_24908 [Lithospermum erythrorhizon]|uniref:Uncharacterized protein n=1 Tax=Lithospermum erythrorhizon TaxID=34254 RepID=A0AAV3R417_LITER
MIITSTPVKEKTAGNLLPACIKSALLKGQPLTNYRDLVYEGNMKVNSVAKLANETEGGDYWIRGFFQIYKTYQKLYYIGCSNCFTKIDVDLGVIYDCHFYEEKKVISCIRPLVIMSIRDDSGASEVVAVGRVAERIKQTTAEQITELKKMGQIYDLNSIQADFEDTIFLMLLHRGFGIKDDLFL